MKKVRSIKLEDRARIVRWLNEQHEWLQSKPSYSEAARRCGMDTKLDISPHSIKDTANAFGIGWEPAIITGGASIKRVQQAVEEITRLQQRMAEMRAEMDALRCTLKETALHEDVVKINADLAILRGLIHHLYRDLGTKAPDGYAIPNPRPLPVAGR